MKTSYSIAIKRSGVGDLPELVRALTAEAAGEILAALLRCNDIRVEQVIVTIIHEHDMG